MKKLKEYINNFINGVCMSLADSVPGVSGGTIAFIMGFYDKFIISLDNLFYGNKEAKIMSLKFLVKLGIGWAFGMILAMLFLANVFETHIYEMSSLFIGFIIFALPVVIREEKTSLNLSIKNLICFVFGLFIVIMITYLNRNTGMIFDLNSLNLGTIIYVFLAATLAISAMVLPGISGSTILLIFGLYIPIVEKIKDFLHFDFSTIPILVVFGLGMIFGIFFFIRLLRRCLEKRRSATIFVVLGMMIASIYSIIMGPTTLDISLEMLTFDTFNILFFILGGIIIFALEGLKRMLEKKE